MSFSNWHSQSKGKSTVDADFLRSTPRQSQWKSNTVENSIENILRWQITTNEILWNISNAIRSSTIIDKLIERKWRICAISIGTTSPLPCSPSPETHTHKHRNIVHMTYFYVHFIFENEMRQKICECFPPPSPLLTSKHEMEKKLMKDEELRVSNLPNGRLTFVFIIFRIFPILSISIPPYPSTIYYFV